MILSLLKQSIYLSEWFWSKVRELPRDKIQDLINLSIYMDDFVLTVWSERSEGSHSRAEGSEMKPRITKANKDRNPEHLLLCLSHVKLRKEGLRSNIYEKM